MSRSPIDERCISSADVDAWRQALEGIPHAFAHTVECCRAIQHTTRWPTYLYSFETAQGVRVVWPFAERTHQGFLDLVTPYQFSGPVGTGPSELFCEHWARFARNRGAVCSYAALHPAFSSETYYREVDCSSTNDLYLIDLTLAPEQLIARFDRSRKRALRQYQDAFNHLVYDRDALLAFLIETYPAFLTRVNASRANHFTAETFVELAAIGNVEWVGAANGGRIEAVYVFGFTPYAGDCLLNVATPDGRVHGTLLLWRGMLALKARGVPRLSLGGGVKANDPIAKAKQRFRAIQTPLRSVKQILQPDLYEQLCRDAGADPTDRNGYFPAYYRPNSDDRS